VSAPSFVAKCHFTHFFDGVHPIKTALLELLVYVVYNIVKHYANKKRQSRFAGLGAAPHPATEIARAIS